MPTQAQKQKVDTIINKLVSLSQDEDVSGLRMVERVARRLYKDLVKKGNFSKGITIGTKVSFPGKTPGSTHTGRIRRVNTRSITVITDLGSWSVPPHLITVLP